MNLIEAFLNEIGCSSVLPYNSDIYIEYFTDSSDFVFVDGEEGDYGKIKYFSKKYGNLIATKEIYGGDGFDITFTSFGVLLLESIVLELVKEKIKNLQIED